MCVLNCTNRPPAHIMYIPSIHVYSQKVHQKCKQNHVDMQDRKVMQDSYNCPKK